MNKPVSDLNAAAMKLSPEDRLRLVESILASLAPADAAVDEAWSEEVRARVADYERGVFELEDWDAVFAEARAALRR